MFRVVAALALAACLFAPPSFAQAPAPPAVAAAAWTLVDVQSGQTIASHQADERRDPASITKLMTAYIVFGAVRRKTITPSQMVDVSERAWRAEGSRMFIEPRKSVSVDELMHGMIVQSGNDASIALAELVSGSEAAFVETMNAEARRLGMLNTQFANATGLADPKHWSTAGDLAKLAQAVIRDYPEFYPFYALREYRYNKITQPNRNRLLWSDPYVDGMKTGHTEAAGWCLVASAKRGERRLLSVVLGASSDASRAAESQKLLNFGFQAYDTVQLYQSGKPVSALKVWKGADDEVDAGFLADRYLTLPRGRAGDLKLTLEAMEPLIAPVTRGQRVGVVRIALDGGQVAEFPLIALGQVEPANLLVRAWHSVRLWFK
ncbi:MAG TPA: D-alanyl-D-alanine carboxypeptidase family protein [Casimicrobiaceae bacterium]|nr:D-alanyl-D-alanine carboxypeptidase family protein [Casimicrobiaceae bacterium]